jgi:uncharacterized membrane protein YphA (DoxX/SURF4 family)
MTNFEIPLAVLYTGLGAVLLSLVVATIQNNWSLRVFFILALRLAIGWHFLFEGLHKIHSHRVGPTETNRVFSSEPYFRMAPGPAGELMRKQFNNPAVWIATSVRTKKEIPAEVFASWSVEEQATACPEVIANDLETLESRIVDVVKAEAEKELVAADADEKKALAAAKTDDERTAIKTQSEKDRVAARNKAEKSQQIAKQRITEAKAEYARWLYGVDKRDTKVKFVSGDDVPFSAPQRLAHLDWLRNEVQAAEERLRAGLGQGYNTEQKRASELRTEFIDAESSLASDAQAFLTELKTDLNGGKAEEVSKLVSRGQRMDLITMWFLVGVGVCLLAGFCTPLACLLGAGFLVMTYLAHPAFPWYPLPPNTEGNPVFINKNVIECIALLVILVHPTGRWMGIDALLGRICCRRKPTTT